MSTESLLRTIGYPGGGGSDRHHASEELYELARKNKVGSLYVRSLHDADAVDGLEQQWENRRQFQANITKTLSQLAEDIPDHYEYALVKSTHDFWADSKDVDLIVFEGRLDDIQDDLTEQGYEFCGDSPTSFDVKNPETGIQLDVQSKFSLQRVVYFDKRPLRVGVQRREIDGTRLPVVSKPDDLALIVIHSITEQLFILKEYFAAVHALEEFSQRDLNRFVELVDRNNIGPACRGFFTIVDELTQEVFDRRPRHIESLLNRYPPYENERDALIDSDYRVPHRYTRSTGLRTVVGKARNPEFLRSVASQAPRLARPSRLAHISSSLLERREREHYVHDTSDFEDSSRS